MRIRGAQSTGKHFVEANKMLGQEKVVYTVYYTCIHACCCWYPALSYAVSADEAEGFPLNFVILTATAPVAPACLSL